MRCKIYSFIRVCSKGVQNSKLTIMHHATGLKYIIEVQCMNLCFTTVSHSGLGYATMTRVDSV